MIVDSFAQFNLLDSSDILDVRYFTANEIKAQAIKEEGVTLFDFYSMADLNHADKWPHPQFDYRMNYLGFRMEEVPKEVDIAVFGCSFTFGLGLPTDMLWHTLLSKELNMSCVNFGLAGASVKTIIDIFLIVSKHIKIKKAIFLLPTFTRMQIAKHNQVTNKVQNLSAIPGHESQLCMAYGIDTDMLFRAMPSEELFKIAKNEIYLAEYIAKVRGIETYFGAWEEESAGFLNIMDLKHSTKLPQWYTPAECVGDLARDQMHPGPKHHAYWFNSIKHLIK